MAVVGPDGPLVDVVPRGRRDLLEIQVVGATALDEPGGQRACLRRDFRRVAERDRHRKFLGGERAASPIGIAHGVGTGNRDGVGVGGGARDGVRVQVPLVVALAGVGGERDGLAGAGVGRGAGNGGHEKGPNREPGGVRCGGRRAGAGDHAAVLVVVHPRAGCGDRQRRGGHAGVHASVGQVGEAAARALLPLVAADAARSGHREGRILAFAEGPIRRVRGDARRPRRNKEPCVIGGDRGPAGAGYDAPVPAVVDHPVHPGEAQRGGARTAVDPPV